MECKWEPFTINYDDIGAPNTPVQVEVWDWDGDGGHDIIGEFQLTLTDIFLGPYTYAITNSKYRGIPGYSTSGGFTLSTITPLNEPQLKLIPLAVEITASGNKLEIKDVTGSSDPFFEIKIHRHKALFNSANIFNMVPPSSSSHLVTHYRSDVCPKTVQPKWKPFELHLNEIGGMDVEIEIKCWDFDGDGGHDLIGVLKTTYRELVLNSFQYKLVHPEKKNRLGYQSSGAFSVDAIKPIGPRSQEGPLLDRVHRPIVPLIEPIAYKIKASGAKIVNVDVPIAGKSDPYFEIHKTLPGLSKPQVIYRSSHVENSSSPQWPEFVLLGATLGGMDEPFTVAVFDRDPDGINTQIGNFTTTLREWMVGPYVHAIVNPSKVGRVGYESSGAWKMESITPLMEYQQPSIGQGMEIQCVANKLDSILGKDAYYEAWVVPPKISGSKKQFTSWLYYRSGYGNNTSASTDIRPSYSWKPTTLWYLLLGSFDVGIKIKVFNFDRIDGYTRNLVGCCSFSLYELLIGPYLSPLIDKHKKVPGYKSSGGFEIKIHSFAQNPPQFHPATGYNLRFRIGDVEKVSGKPPLGQIKVLSRPLGEEYKCTLYKHYQTQELSYDVFLPFEGCGVGGPFEKLVWKYEYVSHDLLQKPKEYKGEFKASLYEFTLDDPTFFFKSKELPLGRKHLGKFIIEEIRPVHKFIDGFNLTFKATNLDITDWYSTPAPYLVVKNSLGNILYTSEIHGYSQQPQWLPFPLALQSVGGMNEDIILECWTSHGPNYPPEFVGYKKITLRKLSYAMASKKNSFLFKNDAMQAKRPQDKYNAGTLTLLSAEPIIGAIGLEWNQPLQNK
uniref:C2 domain-containing protein n=1 Tax=Arcella intermedia TaxID=1963864 RepID=A0A6B2KXR9_9EUKA